MLRPPFHCLIVPNPGGMLVGWYPQRVLIYHFSWFENVSREQSSCFYSSPACRAAIHMFVKLIVADETCMSQCPVFNKNTALIVISCSTPIVHDIRNLFSSSKKNRVSINGGSPNHHFLFWTFHYKSSFSGCPPWLRKPQDVPNTFRSPLALQHRWHALDDASLLRETSEAPLWAGFHQLMDWFKGQFTGKLPYLMGKIRFPEDFPDFPLNQSTNQQLDWFYHGNSQAIDRRYLRNLGITA